MRRFNECFAVAVFACCLVTASVSNAALTYGLEFVGPVAPVTVGSTFTMDVFLRETSSDPLTFPTQLGSVGLIQGNFRVNRTGSGAIDIIGVTGSSAFDNPVSSSFGADFATVVQADDNPAPTPTGVELSPSIYRLFLGQLTLAANAVGTNTFTFADFDPLSEDLFLGNAVAAEDTAGFTYGSITVTAVPEPGSMALLALAGIGGVVYRRRRRSSEVQKTSLLDSELA